MDLLVGLKFFCYILHCKIGNRKILGAPDMTMLQNEEILLKIFVCFVTLASSVWVIEGMRMFA